MSISVHGNKRNFANNIITDHWSRECVRALEKGGRQLTTSPRNLCAAAARRLLQKGPPLMTVHTRRMNRMCSRTEGSRSSTTPCNFFPFFRHAENSFGNDIIVHTIERRRSWRIDRADSTGLTLEPVTLYFYRADNGLLQ